jgi:hypothetical protein
LRIYPPAILPSEGAHVLGDLGLEGVDDVSSLDAPHRKIAGIGFCPGSANALIPCQYLLEPGWYITVSRRKLNVFSSFAFSSSFFNLSSVFSRTLVRGW